VDEQITEKLFGQLVCLPQTSLLVDVKELGYDNGAVAVMDLVRQFKVGFTAQFLALHHHQTVLEAFLNVFNVNFYVFKKQCFLLTVTAVWCDSMLSPRQEHCYCHRRDTCLKLEVQGSPFNCHSVPDTSWQHGVSKLSPVRNTVILQCFDAGGWVTGRASTCKKYCNNSSQKFTFRNRCNLEKDRGYM